MVNGASGAPQKVSDSSTMMKMLAEVLVDLTCCLKSHGYLCASCCTLKVKCEWPPGSKMAEAHHESLKVMRDMTHAMNHLAAAMETSNLGFGGSEESSGEMKLSKDEGDLIELGGGEGVSEEGGEEVGKETSAESSGGDEDLPDVGSSRSKKQKLR